MEIQIILKCLNEVTNKVEHSSVNTINGLDAQEVAQIQDEFLDLLKEFNKTTAVVLV